MKKCRNCSKDLDIRIPVGRKDVCPFCGSDLRCCLNCSLYEAAAYNGCRESQAERVVDKERGNFCDYFVFQETASGSPGKDADAAKKKLASLFR